MLCQDPDMPKASPWLQILAFKFRPDMRFWPCVLQAELETALAKKEALQRTEVLRATQLAEASVDAEAKVRWALLLAPQQHQQSSSRP
jgi:hypothetical protein